MISSEDVIARLNPVQQEAVVNFSGPSLIIAGAGSGKTRVLTHRIAYMLAQGIRASNVLALTFTNKAANEMKERISMMVGDAQSKFLWMGTFHSVFAKILRFEAEKLGFTSNFTIYDSTDSKSLIRKLVKELNLEDDKYKPGEIASKISHAKNNLITPQGYLQNKQYIENDRFNKRPEVGRIYQMYQNRCRQSDAMDFDDILLYTNILFRDFPEVVEKYREKYHYILVDEYQDTNFSQYLIIKRLSQNHHNVTVVGDDAQSIYSFRGAKIENILNFKNDYPEFKMYKLEQNYRSTKTIVDAANSLIKKNKTQIAKNTFSHNEDGETIKVLKCSSETEEGFRIAMQISTLSKNENRRYSDFAILYRTNAQSRVIEEALNKMRIPCKIHGGLSFFQRAEIKDIVAYFRLIINHKDDEALTRVINYPARGIGDTTLDKMTVIGRNNSVPMWEVVCRIEDCAQVISKATCNKIASFRNLILQLSGLIDSVDAYTFASEVLEKTGILRTLADDHSVEGQSRYENVQELLNAIKEFTESEQENGILQYLEKISLISDVNEDEDVTNKVTLMTVHSAKGLEFMHCFLVGMEENLFPSLMSINSEKDIEEERRLFYVALTRAQKTATLSYALTRRHWGKFTDCKPSRFILEIDNKFLDTTEMSGLTKSFTNSVIVEQTESPKFTGFTRKPIAMSGFKKVRSEEGYNSKPSHGNENLVPGVKVEHVSFGRGIVKEMLEDRVVVEFNSFGVKTLLLKFAKFTIL